MTLGRDATNSDIRLPENYARRRPERTIIPHSPIVSVNRVLGIYILLWVFEGLLRKYIPGANVVFYVARDGFGLAAFVYFACSRPSARRIPWQVSLALLAALTWVLLQTLLLGNHLNVPVLIAGIRSYAGPLIFAAIAIKFGNPSTLARSTQVVLAVLPIELGISIVQVLSPPTASINLLVDGSVTNFVNDGEAVRASGTFSSPIGLAGYIGLVAALALAQTIVTARPFLGNVSVVGALVLTFISGARTNLLTVGIILAVYLILLAARPKGSSVRQFIVIITCSALAYVGVLLAAPGVITAFVTRIGQANQSENSGDRLFGTATDFFQTSVPLLGSGVGSRSNSGIGLGAPFPWIEVDTLRWVAELGIAGYVLSTARFVFAVWLAIQCLRGLRSGSATQVMLGATVCTTLLFGTVNDSPSAEGAFSIAAGCIILSARRAVVRVPTEVKPLRTRPMMSSVTSQSEDRTS